MSTPVNLTQFGLWLTDQQENLVKTLWQDQKQAQEILVKDLWQSLKGTQSSSSRTEGIASHTYYHLNKFTPEDDIKAYLSLFEMTAMAAL